MARSFTTPKYRIGLFQDAPTVTQINPRLAAYVTDYGDLEDAFTFPLRQQTFTVDEYTKPDPEPTADTTNPTVSPTVKPFNGQANGGGEGGHPSGGSAAVDGNSGSTSSSGGLGFGDTPMSGGVRGVGGLALGMVAPGLGLVNGIANTVASVNNIQNAQQARNMMGMGPLSAGQKLGALLGFNSIGTHGDVEGLSDSQRSGISSSLDTAISQNPDIFGGGGTAPAQNGALGSFGTGSHPGEIGAVPIDVAPAAPTQSGGKAPGSPGTGDFGANAGGLADVGNATTDAQAGEGGAAGGGGDGSVVCTALHEMELTPTQLWDGAEAWGRECLKEDVRIIRGYHRWGKPVADWLRLHPKAARVAAWALAPAFREMCFRTGRAPLGDPFGRVVCNVGKWFCKKVGTK